MDLTFILSAIIFTLLAIVVATSLFNGSTSSADFAMGYFGHKGDGKAGGGLGKSAPKQNGHLPDKKNAVDDWSELTGSHDHWDVVKSVLSEETHAHPPTEEVAASVERSTSSPSSDRPPSREMSLDVDSSSEASSGRSRRSFIGLSDKELLKCAFSHPQTEGATESPVSNDKVESAANNSLRYIPGKARTSHLETMMSRQELEEERRIELTTDFTSL
ncbi:matrix-remodeling-associated protein 7 isoform X2 [Myripristis murdjan]|uniref:matrix-remodeling-associated protein 7 isoform X2 n=1 Tax=Myripristis murdjan TaxID=586833 RepID=UPI001175FA9D|nr:uncharacterized protein LOC115377614 isoform X2 [Myripristis murdjan]